MKNILFILCALNTYAYVQCSATIDHDLTAITIFNTHPTKSAQLTKINIAYSTSANPKIQTFTINTNLTIKPQRGINVTPTLKNLPITTSATLQGVTYLLISGDTVIQPANKQMGISEFKITYSNNSWQLVKNTPSEKPALHIITDPKALHDVPALKNTPITTAHPKLQTLQATVLPIAKESTQAKIIEPKMQITPEAKVMPKESTPLEKTIAKAPIVPHFIMPKS
ncbi:hypothetical protein KBD08_03565 [Candidatus Babeliales bacterium]|nr:hypothetical protein [Candidatus Babeliales bacterium]